MAVNGFGKASGPSSTPPNFQNPFANISPPTFPSPASRPVAAPQRPSLQPLGSESSNFGAGFLSPYANHQRANFHPPAWGNGQKGPGGFSAGNTYHRPPAAAPPRVLQNPVTGVQANNSQIPQSKRSRSPTSVDSNSNKFEDSSAAVFGRRSGLLDGHSRMVVQRTSSPALTFQNNQHAENLRPSFGETRRQPPTSTASIDRPRSQVNYADVSSLEEFPALPSSAVSYNSHAKFATTKAGAFPAKQIKSSSSNEADRATYRDARNVPKRNSNSPPRMVSGINERSHSLTSIHDVNFPSTSNSDLAVAGVKSNSVSLPKRTRSPPLPDHVSLGNSYLAQDETEREILAKAKRLARFKVELTQTMADDSDNVNQKLSGNKDLCSAMEVQKNIGENSTEAADNFPSIGISDEGTESSRVITGLCPDMCPESERAERERKGDLDQFERVDGDRNQTSKFLAVKKYTRTAERQAMLIRPMPVLQRTIDYLLSLLNQHYDVTFLGMYNFLWDRMRAVRMDLRMQHIFDLGAITMLEQMIRLHIVAMHELCEYTKGEGFSEGFDAHLNIEQMNKASVELFQLYDDHRKRGVDVPTEKEFRGYYALLKLDKHPGYKVEPAELSLDLAKMTPEMRQTSEVLFARDVARACRTGNYIAFFRLAKKASYLQACLMHAHFAKLRNQALASLHSGLQNNQGIPVAQVASWLGMEEEDIESLMDYHGFSIKEFEEPYMVKDALFINSDKDYPTRCSELVHRKKSKNIIKDILSSSKPVSSPVGTQRKPQLKRSWDQEPPAVHIIQTVSPSHVLDEDMPDFKAISSPKDTEDIPIIKRSPVGQKSGDGPAGRKSVDGLPVDSMSNVLLNPFPMRNPIAAQLPAPEPLKGIRTEKPDFGPPSNHSPGRDAPVDVPPMPVQIQRSEFLHESPHKQFNAVVMEKSILQDKSAEVFKSALPQHFEEVETDDDTEIHLAKEVAEAKLKLMFRLWKRRCWKLKGLREQKLQAATAALSSLSLGPPMRQNITAPITSGEINIDDIMRERYRRRERSWSKLNVSEVIAEQLRKQNPEARCLCFKLVICSQITSPETNSLGKKNKVLDLAEASWLLSKLIPQGKGEDKGLAVSSPGVAIWKKWISVDGVTDMSCCLAVIKDMTFDQQNETGVGASAVLFLFSLKLPWELQKVRLHNLVKSLPSSSSLPLLILSGSHKDEMPDFPAAIFKELGLTNIDKSKISKISIQFLVGEQEMETFDGFYSDEQLKEGLRWVASEIPEQPLLCHVKTRDLVLNRLNLSLEDLGKMSGSKVEPGECISAFNEALDHLKCRIGEAANANLSGWPCPEISLLEEFSDEYWACKLFLPSIGWSSIATIDPLIRVLDDIKLPPFSDGVSWLTSGFNTVQDIENQRIQVENCIFRYLTESTRLMGIPQAKKEACIILQRNAGVELHNSSFYIIPNWVGIFRRIFNWQLQSLSSGDFRDAYILEQEKCSPLAGADISSPYYLNHPSLDEMVEVGCIPVIPRTTFPLHGVHRNQVPSYSNSNGFLENAITNKHCFDDGNSTIDKDEGGMGDYVLRSSELEEMTTMVKIEANRLGELLENCNSLQDRIDRKLSVYF